MRLKPVVIMMALLPVMAVPTSTAVLASDLSLYRGNTTGKTSILLMLDTSGSMGISSLVLPKNNKYGSPGDVDNSICIQRDVYENSGNSPGNFLEYQYNAVDRRPGSVTNGRTSFYKEVVIGGTRVPYYVRGCGTATVDGNGKLVESDTGKFDRLSRLKDAIITLLADENGFSDVSIGLGHFSTQTSIRVGKSDSNIRLVDGHSGNILVPSVALTKDVKGRAHRLKLAQAIAQFQSLDTTTKQDGSEAARDGSYSSQRYSSLNPPQDIKKASSGTPTAHAYAEAAAYMMGTQTRPAPSVSSHIQYVYDGAATIRKGSQQVYFICVEVKPNNVANDATALNAGYVNVKQCINAWPALNNGRLNDSTKNSMLKSSTSGGWVKPTQAEINAEFGSGNITEWEMFTKLPAGWRYGGWMKVDNEPMDIEPITASPWQQGGADRNLVSYRVNPFSLNDKMVSNKNAGYDDNLGGGISYSDRNTKNEAGTKYIAGGSDDSCDGNGIYVLTDGAPNSTKDNMARAIMNDTLTTTLVSGSPVGTYGFSAMPLGSDVLRSPVLQSNLFSGETGGWEYIGEYSKKILDPTKNPANMKIKTAVVGFGSSFAGIRQPDGSYNCEAVRSTNLDAYNACKWGGAGFGDGGFYYAENVDDIKNSIIQFVKNVTVGLTPSSLGSISVPRDPLDPTKYMTQGFFPMIMPVEDSTFRTWAGNLKKYNIVGGTLKGSSGDSVYKLENNQQFINSSAKDLWSNDTTGTDHSLINSGGAWNKIPVPSTVTEALDAISNLNSVRKVYVLDGSSLKQITTQNLATDYTGTGKLTGTYTVNQRLALLNYLGYKTTFPAAASQTTLTNSQIAPLAVNPASPYRFLGGVLHSTPLMVTKESTVSSNNAVGSREEYTVYGSMEGGLHIVNSATGKEQSVFVPQEILSNQYDTLASSGSTGVESLTGIAYGVDAPWVADNTFKVQTTTSSSASTTKYIANKINIYGGLRMGGKALYGLDILSPASPKILFHITPSTSGFGRMAQIWSKPTIAEIRVKGERKKVLIFGGGYDADVYERPAASFTEPSSTYGNALYIVDATTGALIWISSSDTAGIAESYKKTENSDLKYSVVGQPVVRDYDADGLADMIYFADLGGQIFRVDLNNNNQMSNATDTNIAVRVQTLAKLRTTTTTPFVPRFYDRLSTAVFDDGQNRFVLVTAGSGNRSFPLEEEVGGKNKVYGLIDRDAAANGLETPAFVPANVITPSLLSNTGILGKTATKQIANAEIEKMKLTTGSNMLRGWSFELRSVDSGNYARAFEESQLITGDLYVSLYDPKATLTGTVNACGGGVTGISTTHRICMPYGDCAAYVKTSYQGINGPAFGVVSSSDPRTTSLVAPIAETREACVGNCEPANTTLTDKDLPKYSQVRKIKPVRWFEW
ncbi:hypothetical protein HX120_06445 [Acinetobacter indicus]|nr:hypothetical protein [Acinetobacter indicus]